MNIGNDVLMNVMLRCDDNFDDFMKKIYVWKTGCYNWYIAQLVVGMH
jgi:hypothetical protein